MPQHVNRDRKPVAMLRRSIHAKHAGVMQNIVRQNIHELLLSTSYADMALNQLPSGSLASVSTYDLANDAVDNSTSILLRDAQQYWNLTNETLGYADNSTITPITFSSNISSPEEFCSNSHIISAETIIAFTEDTDAILFVCTLLSSLLQIYVMTIAMRHIRHKTGDKCMHVFLLSMTFADFILTALCYPVELAPRAGLIQNFPKYVSATMHMLCWIALIVSSLSLVFLNLDKLFYFRFPLRINALSYNNYFTQRRAITFVTAFWLFSALFVVFAWLSNSFHCVDDDCVTLAIFPNRLHIYVPFMIFVGVIPTLTSLLVAIYIMKIVAAHRHQMFQERSFCPPTAPGRSNSVFASRMRTFYFIFMTTVFTAITLLPYRVAGLRRSLNPARMHDCMTIMLFWVMMYMIYLHSIINPLITISVLPPYRLKALAVLQCRERKKNHLNDYTVNGTSTVEYSNNAVAGSSHDDSEGYNLAPRRRSSSEL